jgi:hypothetical protein
MGGAKVESKRKKKRRRKSKKKKEIDERSQNPYNQAS